MKIKSANGTKCCLIYTGSTFMIRVYDGDGSFTDYSILHSDLVFTIDDEDAYFYENEKGKSIDHSPETLGHLL